MKSANLITKVSLINATTLDCFDARKEQEIIKSFTDAGIKVLGADFGFAFFRAEQKFQLLYNSPKTPYTPAIPRREGLVATAFRTKQVQLVSNALRKEKIEDHPELMRSVAVIPVVYKKNNYGTIHVCFKNKHAFGGEDRALCAMIGNGAAQAITINRFYGKLEELVAKRTQQLKEMNAKLMRDKAEDQAILTSIGEGLLATDREGKVILFNPAAEKMLGWSLKEVAGKVIYESQPLVDEKDLPVPLEQRPTYVALTSGQQVTINNMSYVTKDGRKVPFSITATPVRLDGEIVGSIQVFRDISKEREIDKAKSELISLASHQLRTPLSGINWYVEALIKEEVGKLNKDQKKYLGEVYRANQKLVELVYDFLNVSRIELGTFNIKLSSVDIKEVVRGVLNELEPIVRGKKLKVTADYEGKLEDIKIDHKIIRLVLQNLITNAAKYTPANGKINIHIEMTEVPKPLLSIAVADTGVGIPKTDQPKIFTKLFRADNIKMLDADGTGLGLYIVKSFIELCGGSIRFKSQEHKGTTFFAELPVIQQ